MGKKASWGEILAPIVGVLLIIAGTIWYEASLWNECRATNSFWYCARVLSK